MRSSNWYLVLVLVLAASLGAMTACGDLFEVDEDDDDDDDDWWSDDDDDDSDGDIDDVPDDVNDFLDPEDIEAIEDAGMPIYKGMNPPNVEGDYYLDSLIITYDEGGMEGGSIVPYDIRYYDQSSSGAIKHSYQAEGVDDSGSGIGGFISGDNGCFSVYLDITGSNQGCEYALPAIHSGCMGGSGINNYYWGFIMKDKSGSNCDYLMPEGAARVIKENDGLAAER